jgi:lysozyme
MLRQVLIEQLRRHEDDRARPYDDKTGRPIAPGDVLEGKISIGVGRNLTDRDLSPAARLFLVNEDIDIVEADLDRNLSGWRGWTNRRQIAIADMCFNLGWPKLAQFKRMILALEAGDFSTAATEMLESAWAGQVGDRAQTLSRMMRDG